MTDTERLTRRAEALQAELDRRTRKTTSELQAAVLRPPREPEENGEYRDDDEPPTVDEIQALRLRGMPARR